jgi:glycosyltransferase involved in cell wall biosynthesis
VKIILAIPAFRCRDQLPRVLRALTPAILERLDSVWVIDNRSDDGTVEAAIATVTALNSPKIEIWRNTANVGLGGTHKVAFLKARELGASHLAILHGDDQGRADEITRLIELAHRHPEAAAILGARFMPGSRRRGYSVTRTAGNILLNIAYTSLSGRLTWDLGSGLNLFRLDCLPSPDFLGFSDGFTFNMDLLLSYYRHAAPLVFCPITWSELDQKSGASALKVGWAALARLLGWRVGRPVRATVRAATAYTSERVFQLATPTRGASHG